MKQTDSKDKSSVVFIGKGVIILSVIITASLSFVLGFFVGKSIQPQPVIQTSALPLQNVETVSREEPVQQPEPVQETAQTPVPDQVPATPDTQQARDIKKTKPAEETKKQSQAAKPSLLQENKKEVVHNSPQSKKYAVQVEAFQHLSSANSLKAKLNKKGFKASVTTLKTKKHETLYKVIVGDFQTRNDAEALSAKLKKSENLQHAFVIPKND